MPAGENKEFGGLPISRLVRRYKDAEFENLVHRHWDAVYGCARARVANEQDVEDIVNQTFARAWNGRFRRESKEITWLRGICINLCIDYYRHKARQPTCVSFEELLSSSLTAERELSKGVDTEAARDAFLLEEAIRQLPEDLRNPFILVPLRGVSKTEAAKLLGLKRTTLNSRVDAACKRLAAELREPPPREGA